MGKVRVLLADVRFYTSACNIELDDCGIRTRQIPIRAFVITGYVARSKQVRAAWIAFMKAANLHSSQDSWVRPFWWLFVLRYVQVDRSVAIECRSCLLWL